MAIEESCEFCGGVGLVDDFLCPECGGSGRKGELATSSSPRKVHPLKAAVDAGLFRATIKKRGGVTYITRG